MIFVGRQGPEISSGKGNEPIWNLSIQKRCQSLTETATCRFVTGKDTKLRITHSFFELQTPDFAWKFIWIFRTNYKSKKVHKYS